MIELKNSLKDFHRFWRVRCYSAAAIVNVSFYLSFFFVLRSHCFFFSFFRSDTASPLNHCSASLDLHQDEGNQSARDAVADCAGTVRCVQERSASGCTQCVSAGHSAVLDAPSHALRSCRRTRWCAPLSSGEGEKEKGERNKVIYIERERGGRKKQR